MQIWERWHLPHQVAAKMMYMWVNSVQMRGQAGDADQVGSSGLLIWILPLILLYKISRLYPEKEKRLIVVLKYSPRFGVFCLIKFMSWICCVSAVEGYNDFTTVPLHKANWWTEETLELIVLPCAVDMWKRSVLFVVVRCWGKSYSLVPAYLMRKSAA